MIKEIRVKDIKHLQEELNKLPNNYIFRGQSNAEWTLSSTLERVLDSNWTAERAKKHEDFTIDTFQAKYHIYNSVEHEPKTKFGWLSVMQHYGVPTRLIDFTESPYVALYFALETYDFGSDNDMAIYAIDYKVLMDTSLKNLKSSESNENYSNEKPYDNRDKLFDDILKESHELLFITEPHEMNIRMDRQSGTFLISGDPGKKIDELLSLEIYEDISVIKLTVPNTLRENIFALLRKMNINAKTIYGDLFGLAGSIRMQMQIYSN